ncbi:MAG: FAD-dependent monooxygenase [Luminiphilus sp.]|nr:FAD-dependent monooxygenase [Luminiphilus sp.]
MSQARRVLILGGGLAGLSFAIAIATENPELEITLLEAQPFEAGTPNPLDTRGSALNLHSVTLLERWGLWSEMATRLGAIRDIHVSHRGHFGSALMTAEDLGVPALGYVAENHELGRCLLERAQALGVDVRAPVRCAAIDAKVPSPVVITSDGEQMDADLVLIAAGVSSDWFQALGIEVKERSVGNHAIVFNASFSGEQRGRAFERFTANGPLAVLPLPSLTRNEQRFNVVWSVPDKEVDSLTAMGEDLFRTRFQDVFGWRLGAVQAVGQRSRWPLVRRAASELFRSGFLLVGNAAHTLHPVAGQGLNLSLREAALLAETLTVCRNDEQPLAALGNLKGYLNQVSAEQHFVTQSTDTLATLFDHRGPVLDAPRNASLTLLDLVPFARARVASVGTGRRYG